MFKSKPATVDQAVAPFEAVRADLAAVIESCTAARLDAVRQIAAAEGVISEADAEVARAKNVLAALGQFSGAAK